MIELYAITDHPGPRLPQVAPLTAVPTDGLAAVCAPAGSGAVTADDLWRHEDVVEALMRDRDLLPVRYGTRVRDEAAAARAVAEQHRELRAALDRVRGAVELSLRVVGPAEPPPPQHANGNEYMRAKARRGARRERAVAAIHEPLSLLARQSRKRPANRSRSCCAGRTSSIAPPSTASRTLWSGWKASSDLRLLCTGPWPPYSFSALCG